MSSLTNINNNSAVVNVGRTTPVSPGQQKAEKSIPVVLASDQTPVPVVEQNKVQSEVALSLLGIPRAEVALGIFADVNTYDVNPMEWSKYPEQYVTGYGIAHLPEEAGALIEAPKDEVAILTSKRFFRYQPGRVSAATFGVKSTITQGFSSAVATTELDLNPAIRKFGIFDKFDGYYWETQGDGLEDKFSVVRRTQSLLKAIPLPFGKQTQDDTADSYQTTDYGFAGTAPTSDTEEINLTPIVTQALIDNRFKLVEEAYVNATNDITYGNYFITLATSSPADVEKCKRDMDFALDAYILDLQYGGYAHTIVNASTYRTAKLLAKAEEQVAHAGLEKAIVDFLTSLATAAASAAASRIPAMVDITQRAVNGEDLSSLCPGAWSFNGQVTNRNKLATIFAIYKRYLGYLISESRQYQTDTIYDRTLDDIKHRCLRDVSYVVDGYSSDLQSIEAGVPCNAATRFNAKSYYFNGLKVVSQTSGGVVAEIARHQKLKEMISSANDVSFEKWTFSNGSWSSTTVTGFKSVFTLFGLSSSLRAPFNTLADIIIGNFTTPAKGKVDFGLNGQYGDLVIYRDNLIMTHAAVNDPSLLKPKKLIAAKVNPSNSTITVAEGEFVVGQHIVYQGWVDTGDNNTVKTIAGLEVGKVYRVKTVSGPKSNIISIVEPNPYTAPGQEEAIALVNATITGSGGVVAYHRIEPNIPFIFPPRYLNGLTGSNTLNDVVFTKPGGQFPYLYTRTGELPQSANDVAVGYIDTARKVRSVEADLNTLRAQVDEVNFEFNNWIKQNVDPRYYAVYEYRVPRSRFSLDQLNGAGSTDSNPSPNKVVYSDVASSPTTGTAYPGQPVVLASGSAQLTANSAWNMDFGKVTMLKIEFSWYGAVGALFLAYVPVDNNEARWVRVHHLRCSNQLKIPSLGNATLPITYLVYGGGSTKRLGRSDDSIKSYKTPSQHIVKYGASYYIDGGDRGTVRLYSYSIAEPTSVYGSRYKFSGSFNLLPDENIKASYITLPSTTSDSNTLYSGINLPDARFFMGARVTTSSPADQNVEVIWVDGNKLYLNKTELQSTSGITIIANRPSIAFGLKAKKEILNATGVGVRNRVQVYPTKLSTANLGDKPVKLKILKTPYYQPAVSLGTTFTLSEPYTITSANLPLEINENYKDYLKTDGDFVYGWFRADIGASVGTVFGRLYRATSRYYFTLLQSYSESVTLKTGTGNNFLPDGRFTANGTNITVNESESAVTKERLSSVFVSSEIQTPIPGTGTEIATFFLKPGSDHFDLLNYFDYNKDYLSFPLTNQVESLYLAIDTTQYATRALNGGTSIPLTDINSSLTWEEQ